LLDRYCQNEESRALDAQLVDEKVAEGAIVLAFAEEESQVLITCQANDLAKFRWHWWSLSFW